VPPLGVAEVVQAVQAHGALVVAHVVVGGQGAALLV
jgi:hypothetical protein